MFGQGFGHAGVDQRRVRRQVYVSFGATVDLAQLKIHQPFAQGPVSHHLVGCIHGQINVEAAAVGFVPVLRVDKLARRFGHEFAMHQAVGLGAIAQFLGHRVVVLGFGDEAVHEHPVDDVALTQRGALRVGDRVVGRRRLGQTGQHGRLGNGHFFQLLAEVDFRRR